MGAYYGERASSWRTRFLFLRRQSYALQLIRDSFALVHRLRELSTRAVFVSIHLEALKARQEKHAQDAQFSTALALTFDGKSF